MGGVRVIRILHGVPSLHPGQGGPSRTVVALTDALAGGAGVSVSLVSQGALDEPLVPSAEPGVDRRIATSRSRLALALGLPLRRELGSIGAATRPALIRHRPKTGFTVPFADWLGQVEGLEVWQRVPQLARPGCHWSRRLVYALAQDAALWAGSG